MVTLRLNVTVKGNLTSSHRLSLFNRKRVSIFTYVGDFFNTLKAFIGTNYLSLPFAFAQSGVVVSNLLKGSKKGLADLRKRFEKNSEARFTKCLKIYEEFLFTS